MLDVLACDYRGECPCFGTPQECVCLEAEAVLRAYARRWHRTAMTPQQREACLQEIDRVESFTRQDYEHGTDADLARGVLEAWADYCRDHGLL